MENVIEIRDLTKFYGSFFWKQKVPALDHLTLDVPKGAVFGFLGPNGAGKTTTIRLLLELIHPSSGAALILGRPPSDIKVKEKIGYLPDGPAYTTYLTAFEFLNICAKLLKIPSAHRKKRIGEVLEIVKMSKHADKKLGGFSRGMVQRIGIAQAILNDPELLILDEPLVGLDPHGRQELKDIIIDQKSKGTNVFFCSHILSDVEKICDHLGILCEGKLLCSGKLDELLSATGFRVNIEKGNDELVHKLMAEASGSMRLQDGGWELVFSDVDKSKGGTESLMRDNPGIMTKTPLRESLDDFFFRMIEKARAEV